MELSFSVTGMEQLHRNLRVLVTEMPRLHIFFADALNIIKSRSDEVFAAEGANVEKAPQWPPLAASTMLARSKRWGYYKAAPSRPATLRWTGNLQDNTTAESDDSHGRLTWNAKYAIYHQKPGVAGRPPQRVIIDLSNPTNAEIVRALQKHVHDVVGMFGRQI